MNISVKKFSKKSLSLLIALIMVFSALPLTPSISAEAATNSDITLFQYTFDSTLSDSSGMNQLTSYGWDANNNWNISTSLGSYSNGYFLHPNGGCYGSITGLKGLTNWKLVYQGYTKSVDPGKETGSCEIGLGTEVGKTDIVRISSYGNIFVGGTDQNKQISLSNSSVNTITISYSNGYLSLNINGTDGGSYSVNASNVNSLYTGVNAESESTRIGSVNHYVYDISASSTLNTIKQFCVGNINNVSSQTVGTADYNKIKASGDRVDTGVKNVLYSTNSAVNHENWVYANFSGNDNTRYRVKSISLAQRMVFLNDGVNPITVPTIVEIGQNNSYLRGGGLSLAINYITMDNSPNWVLYQDWKKCNNLTEWNAVSTTDTAYGIYTVNYDPNKTGNWATDLSKNGGYRNRDEYLRYRNTVRYNAPITDYYKELGTFSFKLNMDGTTKNWGAWNNLENWKNVEFGKGTNIKIYALNYKPLKNIIDNDDFKNNFSNIAKDDWKYTDDSLAKYYLCVKNIIDYNLNSYDYSTDLGLSNSANAIKNAVENYKLPEIKTITVTFNNVLGAELKTLNVTPGTTINENDLPSTTSPTYYQDNQHRVYYWAYPGDTEFTVPYTVNDNVEINEKFRLKDCDLKVKSIDGNTSTVSCSVCNGGTYTLDIKAYRDIVSVAQEAINDEAKYDSDSRANLQKVLNNNNTVNDCITIKQVDAKISAIQTAINALVLNKYSITVNYVDEHGTVLGVGENGATSKTYPAVNYGSIQNIVAPTSYDGKKYSVYKWTRDSQGNNTISGLNSSSLDVVVKGASTYYVFLKRTSVDDKKVDNNAVITLNNKSGNVADIGYVPMEQNETEIEATVTVDINNSTITIDNTTLTAPTYSFYTLEGFYINGTLYSESGTVTITKNTVITPYYNASLFVDINRASGETFTINNENTDSYKAKWNQRVTLKSSKEVMWLDENDVVLAQGTTYSFYANSNVTIKTKEVGSVGSVIPTASIGYFDYDSTLNKVTVVNNFFVPDGMKVTEAGVILSTKNSTVDALKKQTNGIFKGGPESFTSTGNQIRISVSRTANTKFTMYALAYVVVDGQKYFANEVKTINYKPQVA